jgi:CRISPR/Cas system-associated exonuclease Cas4 (RecB family)
MKYASFVKASEISEYIYCRRAWWLRVSGVVRTQTPEMLEGGRKHNALSAKLSGYASFKRVAIILLAAGLLGFIILISILFFLK